MDTLINDWTSTKTYATEANLLKALTALNLINVRGILLVKAPRSERWTAIFAKSGFDADDNFMRAVWAGFKVLG